MFIIAASIEVLVGNPDDWLPFPCHVVFKKYPGKELLCYVYSQGIYVWAFKKNISDIHHK